MIKAVIYARLSTGNPVHMQQQIDLCREKAAELGVVVDQVFSEVSPSVEGVMDPQFKAAIDHCAANQVSHFICAEAGRISRHKFDFEDRVVLIKSTGASLEFVKDFVFYK